MTWLGWVSSVLLLATIVYQVRRHAAADGNDGVSMWLYIGQFCASLGFLVYSVSIDSWVFAVTNAFLLVAAVAGLWIYRSHERTARPGTRRAG